VFRHRDQPLAHGLIEAARTVHGNDGDDAGTRGDLLEFQAPRDRHHPDAVERAAGADRRAVKGLVRIQKIRAIGIQMPRIRRQLDGRAHLVADQMDGIEVMGKPDEIAVVAVVAGTPTAFGIVDIGRARDQSEYDVSAAQRHAPLGVTRRQDERCGR